MTCSFVKFSSSIGIFLISANLICRSTDISCFRGSLRLRDNESRLYHLTEDENRKDNRTLIVIGMFVS